MGRVVSLGYFRIFFQVLTALANKFSLLDACSVRFCNVHSFQRIHITFGVCEWIHQINTSDWSDGHQLVVNTFKNTFKKHKEQAEKLQEAEFLFHNQSNFSGLYEVIYRKGENQKFFTLLESVGISPERSIITKIKCEDLDGDKVSRDNSIQEYLYQEQSSYNPVSHERIT